MGRVPPVAKRSGYHPSNAVVGAIGGSGANVVGMIKRRQGNYFFLGAIDCTKKSVSVMPIIAVSLVRP